MVKDTNCVFCGKTLDVRSNNADPFEGRCCNHCNISEVIPTRIGISYGYGLFFKQTEIGTKLLFVENPEKLTVQKIQKMVHGPYKVVDLDERYVVIVNSKASKYGFDENSLWSKFKFRNAKKFHGNVIFVRKDLLKL